MLKYMQRKEVDDLKDSIMGEVNKLKKDLYLTAAAKYFDEIGYKNFKISELAKELETSVGTIYNLFASKEELYLEYLILKLERFLKNLNEHETSEPRKNLELYLQYKYEIFLRIDQHRNQPITNDPYFFHKLDVSNHAVVGNIYNFLVRQFKLLLPTQHTNHMHIAILFKKFSDGVIESYLYHEFDTGGIIEETIEWFFNGVGNHGSSTKIIQQN